ncbi:MAG: prepilin-type N-terminal cleavage/methylation domain-containing protein [Verrucomicrobia bacterium]|nr:MAG: prepilin-type N-terminal cleavage/methylation domain-containing protein [Verrucomicrobiota bacterium]
MKLTQTKSIKRQSGMTLLELTVVILVLLSLISILFIGARAWKKGADRAGCILNIRNFQQATRSYANMHELNPGDTCAALNTVIIGTGLFMEKAPTCPSAGTYSGTTAVLIPAVGTVALTCSLGTTTDAHAPAKTEEW